MELLCPTCQRKLVIPDTSAGQPAKCPQCGGIFTAPALPDMPAPYVPPAAPIPPVTQLPPPVLPPGSAGTAAPTPLHSEIAPTFDTAIHSSYAPPPPPPPAPSTAPTDYTHHRSIRLHPGVLQGLAVVAVLAVFVLSFAPWLGRYPGGVPVETQTGWQVGFGGATVDKELAKKVQPLPDAAEAPKDEAPGANGLLICYLLLLLLLLPLTVAAVILPVVTAKLPPVVERLKPWRWGLVTGLGVLAFVLLLIQVLSGFSLEARTQAAVAKTLEPKEKLASTAEEKKLVAVERGRALEELHRTAAVTWTVWLQLLLVVCAALVIWVERRHGRPLPRIEVAW